MKGSLQDINHLIASDNIAKLLKIVTVPSPQSSHANIKYYLSRITERSIK